MHPKFIIEGKFYFVLHVLGTFKTVVYLGRNFQRKFRLGVQLTAGGRVGIRRVVSVA